MSVVYCNFTYQFKRNRALKTGKIYRRLYTDPETRGCDWMMPLLIIMAAASQAVVLAAIAYSFRQARQFGVNIGLVQVIWSINPFLLSIIDLKCLELHKIIGFLLIMTCTGLIGFSERIMKDDRPSLQAVVIASFIVPAAQLINSLIARWALLVKQVDP